MKKLTIGLVAAAVILLALSAASAIHAISETQDAIAAIGKVSFSEESKAAIDAAAAAYQGLDTNIGLDKRIDNLEALRAAEAEYARLAIKTAVVADQRKIADGFSDDDIREKIAAAREAVDTYCSTDECTLVAGIDELVKLEERYAEQETAPAAPAATPAPSETVAVPLC